MMLVVQRQRPTSHPMWPYLMCAAVILQFCTAPSVAATYKCVSPDGLVAYSDSPCGSNSERISPAATPPPTALETTGVNAPLPASGRASPADVLTLATTERTIGGTEENTNFDVFAVLQLRMIAPNDPDWKQSNPRWGALLKVISQDLKQDLTPALRAQAADRARDLAEGLGPRLTAADVAKLLAFYRSPLGQRYIAFQQRLAAIQAEGMTQLTVGMAGGGMSQPIDAPSQKRLDERQRLLANSWISLGITQAMGAVHSSAQGAGQMDQTAVMNGMLTVVAKIRGLELDALEQQYRSDLPQFDAFHRSPAVNSLLSAMGATVQELARRPQSSDPFKLALNRSIERHSASWKASYQAGR